MMRGEALKLLGMKAFLTYRQLAGCSAYR